MADTEELVRFEASGLSWTVERAFADAVRGEVAERIDDVGAGPAETLIKRNLVRTVWRVPLSGPAGLRRTIVKRYAVHGPLDWVKYTFKPSRAAAEWRVGRALTAAGVPTAVPLAMAERRRGVLRDAALVTREIPDALHLNAYVEAHLQGDAEADRRRAALYGDLARIVRRMHDAGFVHNDLHGGNVLVSGEPDAPELRVIDLHSVSGPGSPSVAARWFDLAKLLHSMLTCSTEAERVALLETYDAEGAPSSLGIGAALRSGKLTPRLEARLAAMERKRVKSRTERCLDRSSRFDVTRLDAWRIHHLRTLPAASITNAVRAHLATLRGEREGDVLKDARRSALSRQTLGVPGDGRSVIVKEYRAGSALDRLKNLVRRPREVSAWLGGNGLLVRHFDVAEPLALVLGPRLSGPSFLLMEDLGDRARLDLVALERFAGELDGPERRAKRELIRATADLFRRLHAGGTYHGDLKAVNLFVRESGAAPSIALADYDRVEFDRFVAPRRRVKNLSQLSASLAICVTLCDRLRFFRDYAATDEPVLLAWKTWFRDVVDACRRKIVVEWDPIE